MTATDRDARRESGRVDPELWRRLWRFGRVYRRELAQVAGLAVLTAAADLGYPQVTRALVDGVVAEGFDLDFTPYLGWYALLVGLQCLSVWRFISLCGRVRTHLGHDIRRAGFESLQRLSFSYYDHRPVGWLMARMTSDCERLSNLFAWGVLDLSWAFAMMAGVAGLMLWMQPLLGALVLLVLPVLVAVSLAFQRRILAASREVRRTNARLTAAYNEGLAGVRTTRTFAREAEDHAEFDALADEMRGVSVRSALYSALYLPLVLTLGSVATGLALAAGGAGALAGGLGLGTLIAFMVYARTLFEPVQDVARRFAELLMAQVSAERILGLIDTVPEVRDAPEVLARAASERRDGAIREIEFRDVAFAYRDGEGRLGAPVLEGFDLRVRAGETIALVGRTGGGKSTIVNLLARFYEPTAGSILLDGVDYRERTLRWLQSRLGIVQQDPHLFSGTIAENVRYGRLDATEAEVVEAARAAGADDFVRELERGYDTEVGEGGNRLSTGQKQLVSIARALLADPEILILDEATSSVDTETERRLQRALDRVLAGRTAFVIAHRLSTVLSADRILVIEGGRIAEQGTHPELFRRRGRYHELYAQQRLRESATHAEDWAELPQPAGGGPTAP